MGNLLDQNYYIYDADRVIAYNGGQAVTHMIFEVTKTLTPLFHSHPTTKEKYNGYVKKAE